MRKCIINMEDIVLTVKPLACKYQVEKIYLFGSYARGEADYNSDLDFLIIGGEKFKLTNILSIGEELREAFNIEVDVFEISEINKDSELFKSIMKDKILIYNAVTLSQDAESMFGIMQ